MAKILARIKKNPHELVIAASRQRMMNFARFIQADLQLEPFHVVYYTLLDMFAHGKIKKMIVQMPPQHGKSLGSSRFLPAFMLGRNPDLKVAIASYSTTVARDFNRDVQRIIDSPEYREVFPNTYLAGMEGLSGQAQRSSDVIDMVGHKGSLRVVGRGGALTSKTVDVMILDDVYKNYEEGASPIIRESAWKWYTSVVVSRSHNDSQELIVFTRWHEDDLIGRIEDCGAKIIDVTSWADVQDIPNGAWVRINFEAIKTGEPTEIDPREPGMALWEKRHSRERLLAKKDLDPMQFQCLYQGNPGSAKGKLYAPFRTYSNWQDWGVIAAKGNYTDCADEGTDFLCSINYYKLLSRQARDENGKPYVFIAITDIIYTDEPIETTTVSVPMMLNRDLIQYANVESNNGGKAFGRIIETKTSARIYTFTQTKNKESRIITNAGMVTAHILMPYGWEHRYPQFYKAVTGFLRNFKANDHDDAPDALTGIIEKEILEESTGIRRAN